MSTESLAAAGGRPRRVYVASSWRNPMHGAVVVTLRAAGIDCYDFRNPEHGKRGFTWADVMPSWQFDNWRAGAVPAVPAAEYLEGITHPLAVAGHAVDAAAMEDCDCCVLVLPSGRSSHLELGWFVGQGRRTAVLLDDPCVPELMYRAVDYIAPNLFDLLGWLGVRDTDEDGLRPMRCLVHLQDEPCATCHAYIAAGL